MKIIMVDNFNREGPGHDDKLIVQSVREWWGELIVALLNANASKDPNSPDFFKLVSNDYKLSIWKP